MVQYKNLEYKCLLELCQKIFEAIGYTKRESFVISDVFLTSDLYGIESHGIQRMSMYFTGLKIGRIKKDAKISVISETPISAVLDGNEGMGQLISEQSMHMAIEKAKKNGVGMVVVKNSCHYGIAGYYSKMAAKENLLGISMTNTEALVVPTYGRHPMLGTNPIAFAMPAKPHMFNFDVATSVVPAGKLEVYDKLDKKTPEGWFVDSLGNTDTNPQDFILIRKNKTDGGLLPLGGFGELNGGHKGFGFSLIVELMTGIFAGGFSSPDVRKVPSIEKCCHMFMAIDYGLFGDKEKIENQFSNYLQSIRDSLKAEGHDRIYIHGDKEVENMERVLLHGIPVNIATYKEIIEICEELSIDYKPYLHEIF